MIVKQEKVDKLRYHEMIWPHLNFECCNVSGSQIFLGLIRTSKTFEGGK